MPITLVLPDDADVRFAGSPLVELAWAWHVLVGVDHHPERADWAAGVGQALPAEVHTGLEAWSFAVRAVRSTVLVDPTAVPGVSWAGQLAQLNRMPGKEFAAMMLRPLLRIRGRRGPAVRGEVLALARARGTGAVRAVESMMDSPDAARDELVALLDGCWSVFFGREWEAAEPVLSHEIRTRSRVAGRRGWAAAVRDLSPAITVSGNRIVIDKMQSKALRVAGRGVVLVPTIFGAGHLYVADEPERPVVVHYPLPVPARGADRRTVLRRLAVLANPARLEVCRAIAVEPRSATEIARLWRFTDTAVTKHLSAMRAAGLVRTERVGHFVRYSLDPEAIEELGAGLLDLLRR